MLLLEYNHVKLCLIQQVFSISITPLKWQNMCADSSNIAYICFLLSDPEFNSDVLLQYTLKLTDCC